MSLRRLTFATAVLTACVLVGGSAAADRAPRRDFEAAATAAPVDAVSPAHDESTHYDSSRARTVRIDSVATTSLACDGCAGAALTVQVVHASRARKVTAANVATAWSSCGGCQGWALSLQIVIADSALTVTAVNRALALNAACVNCDTRAAAIQIVVVAPSDVDLSQQAVAEISALRDRLVAQLTAPAVVAPKTGVRRAFPTARPAPPAVTAPLAAITDQVQSVVTADLHATSATHDVQVNRS